MKNVVTIIGGADGPTHIYLGLNWLNISGLIIVLLMLVPNIVYAIKVKNQQNLCTNKIMNILEQIGRYGCMFLMIFNIGIAELGFHSPALFLIYAFGNIILLLAYLIIWLFYFNRPKYWEQILLAVLPVCLFLLSGITMQHYLLVLFSIIFGTAHIYVTVKNRCK